MAERRLILHVGRGKTGSSTIQWLLGANAGALAAQGFAYPTPPGVEPGSRAHLDGNGSWLFGHMTGPADLPGYADEGLRRFDAWLGELASDHHVIVSSEFLWGLTPETLGRFRDIARRRGYRPEAIAYIREQVSYFLSRYAQEVRKGRRSDTVDVALHGFARKMRRVARAQDGPPDAYDLSLGRLEEVFGRDGLIVGLFEPGMIAGGDARLDFLERLGIAPDGFVLDTRASNATGGMVDVEAARLLRLNGDLLTIEGRRVAMLARRLGLTREPLTEFVEASDIRAVRKVYAASNARVCERYFPDRRRLFDVSMPPDAPRRTVDPAAVMRVALSYVQRYPNDWKTAPEGSNA